MRRRLLIAALCMFALPLLASNSHRPEPAFPTSVAFGGHTSAGLYCVCGTPDCICDPGEIPSKSVQTDSDQIEKSPGQTGSSDSTLPDSDSDLGLGALFGVLLVALLLRITI